MPQDIIRRLKNGIELSQKRGNTKYADLLAKKLVRMRLERGDFCEYKLECARYSVWQMDRMEIAGEVAVSKVAEGDLAFAERMVHEGIFFEGNLLKVYLEHWCLAEFKEIVREGSYSISQSMAADIAFWHIVELLQKGDSGKVSQLVHAGIATEWMVETAEGMVETEKENAKMAEGKNWAAGILKSVKDSFWKGD